MKLSRIALAVALAGLSVGANATNGYFSHGYGMKAKGMGGASTTNTDDAFFGANNPAAAAFAGNRMDLGADIFSPIREASNSSDFGAPVTVKSDSNYFVVPEFGYNRMMSNDFALGVSVYGNGGMNTDYPVIPGVGVNLLGSPTGLGVDLMQLIVAPTAAYKLAPDHSIGISPLLGYQRFAARGVNAFGLFSADPANVSNRGYDDSVGYGVRVGYLGKLTPTISIGAAYASKMNFDKFDKYAGLFAEQGDFDIPENYNIGASWQATPELKLALDFQRINYSKINAVGNSVGNLLFLGNPMGSANGPGFGWDDVNVWKLGAEYKYSKALTMRAGYSHNDNPIKGATAAQCGAGSADCGEVLFNILAPAVIKDHVTLGFTYTLASGNELTMAYMHALNNSVSGDRPGAPFGAGTDTIQMYQNSLGIQYSWKM